MVNLKLLNKQSAKSILRLTQIVSVLTLMGAAVIFLFVGPPPWSLPKVEATIEQRPDLRLIYPPYSFSTNRRLDIFAFGDQRPARRNLIKIKPKSPSNYMPGPNATGLTLLATLPGDNTSFVVIKGLDGSKESVLPLGSKVRKSLLAKVDSASIVLTRNAQNTTLTLNTPWRAQTDRLLEKSGVRAKDSYASYAFSPTAASGQYQQGEGMDIRDLDMFMVPLTAQERKELELKPGTGLRITKVVRKGLDVRAGDLLVAVNNRPVGELEQIVALLQQDNTDAINLTLVRSGKLFVVKVSGG